MTAAHSFSYIKLSTLLILTTLTASSCAVHTQETVSVPQPTSTSTPASAPVRLEMPKVAISHSDETLPTSGLVNQQTLSQNIASCSHDYQQRRPAMIDQYRQSTFSSYRIAERSDKNLSTELPTDESLSCKLGALTNAALIGEARLIEAQKQSQEPTLSGLERQQLTGYALSLQKDLFYVNMRRGLLAPNPENLNYWQEAHAIWNDWNNTPVSLENADTLIETLMPTQVMGEALQALNDYLKASEGREGQHQDNDNKLAASEDRKSLIINQTFIYWSQLEARNRTTKQQLSYQAQSLPWLKNITQAFQDKYNDKLTEDDVEKFILKIIEQDSLEVMPHFIALTEFRYQDFDEQTMLESAKTFLIQDVEHLPMSQLLAAMDYAKLGDKTSSIRWLNKAFAQEDMPYKLCQLETLDLNSLSAFFITSEGEWFKQQIKAQCHE